MKNKHRYVCVLGVACDANFKVSLLTSVCLVCGFYARMFGCKFMNYKNGPKDYEYILSYIINL